MNGTVSIYDPVAKLRVVLDPATKTARKNNSGSVFFANSGNTVFTTGFDRVITGQNERSNPATMKGVMAETTENLGSQSVNGVTAQGIRTTMTIPKGQIGNSKDIKVLTERWTSSDLQMLVKVVLSSPDPALFQIPPDYTVTDQPNSPLRLATPAPARGVGRGAAGVPGPVVPAPAPAPLPPGK
jgi:hypothetical protein